MKNIFTKAHIAKTDLDNLSEKALKLRTSKVRLFHLLAVLPVKQVKELMDKYLQKNA